MGLALSCGGCWARVGFQTRPWQVRFLPSVPTQNQGRNVIWLMCKHKDTVVIDDTVVCMDCDHERELEW